MNHARCRRLYMLMLFAASLSLGAQEDESILNEWRQVLQFGIDSEVVELVGILTERGDLTLAPELSEILMSPVAPSIKSAVIELFTNLEYAYAAEAVTATLGDYDRNPPELTIAALRYLANVAGEVPPASLELIREVADERDVAVVRAAISAMGARGGADEAAFLTDFFAETRDTELQAQTLLALGELASVESFDLLVEIVGDEAEEDLLRQYAADSLGKLGDPRAVEVLADLANSETALMRAYAISALGNFDTEESNRLLTAALRDSFWRTRVVALTGLGRTAYPDALPAVMYRARRDPDRPVRIEAFKALAGYESQEAVDTLARIYRSSSESMEIRSAALVALLEADPGRAVQEATEAVGEEWEDSESRLLGLTATALASFDVEQTPAYAEAVGGFYERLLGHPNPGVVALGVRGISRNNMRRFADSLQGLTGESSPRGVRLNAQATLEQWGLPVRPADNDTQADDNPPAEGQGESP